MGGSVVNTKARIGKYCTILQNTTIGNNSKEDTAPVIGENCLIEAATIIIGNIERDDNIKIGTGSVTV